MTPERWARVKQIFEAALDRDGDARDALLDEACGGDAELRSEVESLLGAHQAAGSFLATSAVRDVLGPGAAATAAGPTLRAGDRLGPYEVTAAIGSGGMGEVYRARDVRLERDVAIKILRRSMAADAARLKRFEQEAHAASALNHPNIVALYDTGWHEGAPFVVTELLEGEPLSALPTPLPVRKALEFSAQAASGLALAHERGIIHRDIKPANLFVTAQGQVKILDFGIAKLVARGSGDEHAAPPVTTEGLVVGTVGYMSPEQVRGLTVDFRSDQFSLGCVLYELLTGVAPFRRATGAESSAAVLDDEPPSPIQINPHLPQPVGWIVERCLAKDPADRYASTRDLVRDLELVLTHPSHSSATAALGPRRPFRWPRLDLVLMGALVAAAIVTWRWPVPTAVTATVPRVRYVTYAGSESSPAAAPDGHTIAFSSRRDGRRRIWLKQLATGSEAPLTSGEDDHPRFSPDGSMVLFARTEAGGVSLYRVPVVGGEARKVVNGALYGDFSPDGERIAYIKQFADAAGISAVVGTAAVDGSSPRDLARLDASDFPGGAFVSPRWSRDGRRLAATQSALQLGEPTAMVVIDAETGRTERIAAPGDAAIWPGALAWIRAQELVYAAPESVVGQLTGSSSRLVLWDLASGRVRSLLWSPFNIVGLDVLGQGRIVLEARTLRQNLREIPFTLAGDGEPDERWLTRGHASDRQPIYSPDGEWIAFSSNRSGNLDIWVVSRRSGAVRRLTDDVAHDFDPAFTRDGQLLWSSNRSGTFEVWLADADGSGARQITHDGVDAENPVATPDGEWIVYASANPRARGITRIRPDGSGAELIVSGNLILPEVSPDGQHVAFVADQGSERAALRVARVSDGQTVFEIPLPAWIPGTHIDHGRCRWLPDGRALAFIVGDEDGYGVYVQQFVPGEDTRRTRRRVAAMGHDLLAESLAVSRDGAHLTVSYRDEHSDLMVAEGVAGVDRP